MPQWIQNLEQVETVSCLHIILVLSLLILRIPLLFEFGFLNFHIMSSLNAICWLLLSIAKLVVATPKAICPDFEFHPACYDTDRECLQIIPLPLCVTHPNTLWKLAPIVQQNVGNITCSAKCLLGAANVQILLWPTETDGNNANNAPTTMAPAASGIVSNGVTL